MPALGNRGPEPGKRIAPPKPPALPPPRHTAPPQRPSGGTLGGPLPQQPFAPAQKQAARQVQKAQAKLPAQPVGHAPIIKNPTPAQAHEALAINQRAVNRIIGPNPSPARVKAFNQELRTDPRLTDFRKSLNHYIASTQRFLERREAPIPFRGIAQVEGANQQNRSIAHDLLAQAKKRQEGADINPFGLVDLTKLATKAANVKVPGLPGIAGKVVNEAFDLPAQTFLSSAIAGGALVHDPIAAGDFRGAKALGGSILNQAEHPIRSFNEAPLSTALLLAGGENVLGRVAGRATRAVKAGRPLTGLVSKDVQRAGLARPDLKLIGDERVTDRRYNPDIFRQAAQLGYEKALPNLPGKLAQELGPFQPTGWRLQRHLVGKTMKVGRTDYRAAQAEDLRRTFVRGTVSQMNAAKPGELQHATAGIVQRWIRHPETAVADVQKRLARVKRELAAKDATGKPVIKGKDRAGAEANVANWEALLKNPRFHEDPAEAFEAAQVHEGLQRPITAERLYGGQIKEEQLGAALYPYGIEHLGGVHTNEPHPAHIADYEHSQQVINDAEAAVKAAQKDVHSAELARSKAVGRQTARPVAARPRIPLEHRAAEGGSKIVPAADARVRGAKDRLRVAKEARKQAHETAAPVPKPYPALRKPGGNNELLTPAEILEHLHAEGLEAPGFLSHQPGVAGRRSYYNPFSKAQSAERHHRTGFHFGRGTADESFEAVLGNLAHQAGKAAKLQGRRATFRRLGFGRYDNEHDALAAAENFNTHEGGARVAQLGSEVVPVHLGSGEIVGAPSYPESRPSEHVLRQFGLHEHTAVPEAEHGRFTLVPASVLHRLGEHETALQSNKLIGKSLQRYQSAFRSAKLNTSVPHVAGIVQEQAIRLGAETSGPLARAAGAKIHANVAHLAQLDKHGLLAADHGPLGDTFREIHSSIANRGGLAGVSGTDWQDAVRKADQWGESSGHFLRALETGAKAPGARQLVKGWELWKRVLQQGILKGVEHGTRNALTAKALKESGIIDSYTQVIRMTDEAVQDLIKGKLTPQRADALAEAVDNMGGNWNRQTPVVREAIAKFVPFGLWWLNSMRWLYRLPVTHPVKTGLLAGLYQATREQRNKKGQGFDAASPVPNFLQGTIDVNLPLLGKGKIAPTYYSPGGTLGPEATTTAADLIAPFLSGPIAAAKGQNPLSGAQLSTGEGLELSAPQDVLNVLSALFTGPLPGATQAEKVLLKGGKPKGTANLLTDALGAAGLGESQAKPGTARSWEQVIGKLISPTRFDFPSQATSGGGTRPVKGGGSSAPSVDQLRREYHRERAESADAAAVMALREQYARSRR